MRRFAVASCVFRRPMHCLLTAASLLLGSTLWSAESAALDPVQIEPARRDVWSRGSERFHKQWLIAGALSPDVASRTDPATLQPTDGRAFNTDVANVRWKAHTSWSAITELNAILGAPSDGDRRMAFVAGTLSRERSGAADLSIGAQGPITVWLNGKRVHERTASLPAFTRDSERIPVQMNPGENALLLRLEQVDPSAWPFTVRIVEPGALLDRPEVIVPYLRNSADRLEVHTNLTADPAAAPAEVTALGAGGRVLARGMAARGEPVTLDTSTWPDGAYEVRITTTDAWGKPYLVHLPWYKGDAAAAAQRLIDAAEAAKEEVYDFSESRAFRLPLGKRRAAGSNERFLRHTDCTRPSRRRSSRATGSTPTSVCAVDRLSYGSSYSTHCSRAKYGTCQDPLGSICLPAPAAFRWDSSKRGSTSQRQSRSIRSTARFTRTTFPIAK